MTDHPKEGWIVIPNWGRFQHYGDRTPPWIKVYTELNSRPEWLKLPLSARGLLVTLWLEYARSRGSLDPHQIRATSGLLNVYQSVKPLVDAGFVEWSATKPLPQKDLQKKIRKDTGNRASRTGQTAGLQNAAAYQSAEPQKGESVTVNEESLRIAKDWINKREIENGEIPNPLLDP
jgi:hypothetical protein